MTKNQETLDAINNYYNNYRSQIDKELKDYLLKQRLGAALQIGSAALPMGGIGNLGGNIGKEVLKNILGRKIAQNVGAGIFSGGVSGGLFGLGGGLMNDSNPVQSAIENAISGIAAGGALGSIGSNIERYLKGLNLKSYRDIDKLPKILRDKYNKDVRKFYQDYNQEIKLDKNGKIDFSKRGVQEQLRWNPKQGQNFPDLIKDIKESKRLPDIPNDKPSQKPDVSHYEVYRGKNGDHYIEVFKNGDRRYYITKDTPTGTPHATSTDTSKGIETSLESLNSIIPNNTGDINPMGENPILHGSVEKNVFQNAQKDGLFGYKNPLTGDNRIFTREEIGDMTPEEYTKNEKAIRAQWDSIGIPTDDDMRKEEMSGGGVIHVNSYTRQDGTKVKDYYRSRPSI